ncbi:MAG: carboxypeptidase regulatory-like domain-containing protein [Planctomycetes bacterium]|nr:carboxypeptidase regulatory-like domain-containing protein [Planctomycetota bacterium]
MGRSQKLVVLVSALALVLVAPWLRDSGRGARVVEPRSVERDVPADTPQPGWLPIAPRERVALSTSEATTEGTATDARISRSADEPHATHGRIEVEVVEATLAPAPDVTVILERDGKIEARSTDARGRVAFDFAEELDPDNPARVWAHILASHFDSVEVERAMPPGQPLRLILQPHGALDVQVLTAEGQPVTRGQVFASSAASAAGPWAGEPVSAPIHAGHARLAVDLDLALFLTAQSERDHPSRGGAEIDGPVEPGERVAVTLRLSFERTTFAFRAVDEQGHALAEGVDAEFVVTSVGPSSEIGEGFGGGDDGRFEAYLDAEAAPGERRVLELRHDALALFAKVDVSRFAPGRIDLGDIVLRAAPLVASGRVVDPRGRPLAGLEVEATPRAGTAENGEPVFWFGERSALTGADGTFAVRGALAPGSVRLQLAGDDPQVQPLVVAVGTTGVELVAQATGGLAGRVLFDPDVPYPGRISIDAYPHGHREASRSGGFGSWRHSVPLPPGAFEFDGLLPGSYTVTVSGDEVLAEVTGIRVVGGEIARDPRLAELDLRGRLHLFTFELVPPSPGFELRSSVSYTASGTSAPVQSAEWFLDEDPRLATRLEHIDATLRVEGCRAERFVDPGPRTEVHLRAGLPTRLVLPRGIALPAPPLRLGATLLDEDGKPSGASSAPFDEHGELRCFAPAPGRFRVGWLLERRNANGDNRCALAVEPAQFVEVREQEGEQRIELALTPAALARALGVR